MGGKVIFWNCALGIKSKLDFVKDLAETMRPDLMFIAESEVNEWDLSLINIKGFDVVAANSIKGEFGTARMLCYVRTGFKMKILKVDPRLDMVALDIGNCRFVGVYKGFKRPDQLTRQEFFDLHIRELKKLSRVNKQLMIGGDFNVDLFRDSRELDDLDEWSIEAGLLQLVEHETRWRSVTMSDGTVRVEKSAIDHIYSNIENCKLEMSNSISDHLILKVELPEGHLVRPKREKFTVRDWRNYEEEQVHHCVTNLMTGSHAPNFEMLSKGLAGIVDKVAPLKVIKVKEGQLVNPKIDAIKKRRDRFLKKFKKSRNPYYLEQAKSFTKTLKKVVKKEGRRTFQLKAVSPNPKNFWQSLNFAMGRFNTPITSIVDEGVEITDPKALAVSFAKFFGEKVQKLCIGRVSDLSLSKPIRPIRFNIEELRVAIRSLSNKKSYGVDKIPQNIFRAAMQYLDRDMLEIVNDFCENGMDDSLKVARVIPLHKKGDKTELNNYRPVSNLSVFSKVYEKCLLTRLERELPGTEGDHQHAYRKFHSTETALLTIQASMAEVLDRNGHGILYSVDLSAAFDLLKPDLFYRMFKNKLSEGLMYAIMDFLTNRKFVVEVDNQQSQSINLDRGCVQGSILGPKLFTLYTHGLASLETMDAKVVSYADDTYVLITGDSVGQVVEKTKRVFCEHVNYLTSIGMVVNQAKTEVLWVGREKLIQEIELNGNQLQLVNKMKALGILITGSLSWDDQAEAAIIKGKRIACCFRFLRKYLTRDQFLKAASAHFYGSVFYASSVWYNLCKEKFKIKFRALHYRLLRSACKDFNFNLTKTDLNLKCQRATPDEWTRFITASKVVKIIRDRQPKNLVDLLETTLYTVPRKPLLGRFYDGSKSKGGHQALHNRVTFLNGISEPWLRRDMTDDGIRILMKKEFFDYKKFDH